MERVSDPRSLQERTLAWRGQGERVGFVPTMGALHEGHLSLVKAAMESCDRVVVSIFVNPLQFGPGEDLDNYPRDMDRDIALLSGMGIDALFFPTKDSIYPLGHQTRIRVEELTQGMCGASRLGHFEGVATVVAILLQIVLPHRAYFGKKDYQQWRVIERMAADLFMPVEICGAPIVRDVDGLALSSRNNYLSDDERGRALSLSRALSSVRELYNDGERRADALLSEARAIIEEAVDRVDYIELRHALTLRKVTILQEDSVLCVAAFVGNTRLIDNLEIPRSVN